ncbi:MAG: hypothetical protein H0U36_07645 [Nocardioidaceae bacterium]|nr:hypothetical protein [Nocardioidaceae bacterium]
MRKLSTAAAVAALTFTGLGLTTGTAEADQSSSPWISYREPDFTIAAGDGCTFQVDAHVVDDHEAYRVLETYPDGTDKTQSWKGLLKIAFTNHDTGATVTRNVNGRALIDYGPDGSFEQITILSGHFTTSFAPGNEVPPGIYYVGGKGTQMTLNPDGTKTLVLGKNGAAENLCPALAG